MRAYILYTSDRYVQAIQIGHVVVHFIHSLEAPDYFAGKRAHDYTGFAECPGCGVRWKLSALFAVCGMSM